MSPGIPTRLLATQSDERLLALVSQGHERAFEALVHRYRKPLLSYCRRLRLSDARAEDIVQLALLKTWIAIREGAEVRDLKAWLYRVVHNTAVNALRDAAHDGEPLADPTQSFGSQTPHVDESQFDRRLRMREALAEVAALPPLQREVIVRTAVAGHSHEQVASDLGITNGAVRGLLYRARTTLRTAITALTPPQLLGWLAGRADQGGPGPERLAELAGGGGAGVGVGTAGVGGLLLKGGVVAITAGTVITGAAVVHFDASSHHRDRHTLIAAAAPAAPGTGDAAADARSQARDRELSVAGAHRGASARGLTRHGGSGARSGARSHARGGGGSAGAHAAPGGERTPRSTTRTTGDTHSGAPAKTPAASGPAPDSGPGTSQSGAGSGQGGGSTQGGAAGSGAGGPVGSAAGNGSAGGSSSSSEGSSPGGNQSSSGTGSESGTGSGADGSEGSSSQSSSGGSSGSEPSGGEHSGSLVGTVVHEVGSILEHLLP
jgi:RNA polymerase sigma factor (sigma-70 family)